MSKKRPPALRVATCQFPVGRSIRRNASCICGLIRKATRAKARVAHFPECALSGYAGKEITSWDGFDWGLLREETERIADLAGQCGLWVVLGTSHRLSGRHLPHNSLYLIDPRGRIVDRYDKRFCTGGDLKHYTPGDHFTAFVVDGISCGALICYDVRFPELYRRCKMLGVQCMFHSFYNARAERRNIHTEIMRVTLQARAATNGMWISATNSAGYYQSWPGVFITPDGVIRKSLRQHRAGLMVNVVDTGVKYYDASAPFRERAINGTLHSGTCVRDPRSADRRSL